MRLVIQFSTGFSDQLFSGIGRDLLPPTVLFFDSGLFEPKAKAFYTCPGAPLVDVIIPQRDEDSQ